jgi:DNA-directed RNA polymerase specialized sigma subunit
MKQDHPMALRARDYIAKLPADEREQIATLAAELIREEASLRELRKARERSQGQIAERLGVGQASVSRIERRTDMYISTLRKLIQAMGGELDVVARFPDQPAVRITQFQRFAK